MHPAANNPNLLRIHLFGRPRFVAEGQPFKFRGPAKAHNFLAYLLLHRGSHVTRESLALFHTAQALQACGEAGIGLELLAAAHDEVERRSASFRDEASRHGYASIPFVAAINAAYAESFAAPIV